MIEYLNLILLRQMLLFVLLSLLFTASRDLMVLDSIQKIPWRRAICDNLSHITLGFLSWLIVICLEKACRPWHIVYCLLCGFFAGVVDVDHFLMAKSLRLSVSSKLQIQKLKSYKISGTNICTSGNIHIIFIVALYYCHSDILSYLLISIQVYLQKLYTSILIIDCYDC